MALFWVTSDERQRRMALCQQCPERHESVISVPLIHPWQQGMERKSFTVNRCGKCGCPLVSRVRFGCPAGKF